MEINQVMTILAIRHRPTDIYINICIYRAPMELIRYLINKTCINKFIFPYSAQEQKYNQNGKMVITEIQDPQKN